MSGQITLGGHTYNNVSGEKFEEIKTILNRVEETKKREVRGGDVGIDEDGETTVCIGSGGDRKTWWLDKTQYLNKIPITLFNLADLVAEMKVKDGKTLQYGDSRDRTAFNRNIEAEIMLLGNIKIATRRGGGLGKYSTFACRRLPLRRTVARVVRRRSRSPRRGQGEIDDAMVDTLDMGS